MAPDYLKLFLARRLTTSEPHHVEYINARLSNMKFDDPKGYTEYSEYYGIVIEGEIRARKVEPGKKKKVAKKTEKKKAGRPKKKS